MKVNGNQMYKWAEDLFPICRSITGPGVRETLKYIQSIIPELSVNEIESGTKVFDWTIPDEWIIQDAYVLDEKNNKIIDFKENNLHVLNYSEPINKILSLDELNEHLYSLPDQPTAIPYVTSYYKRRWGFCISENLRKALSPGEYHVVIDSEIKPGVLNYGELLIPGKSKEEVFISTYICHPSMANNELSGPIVATALAKWLTKTPNLRYSYRFVFIPETIGSIAYLSRHIKYLQQNVFAGFNVTCVGDDRCYSYLPSRKGDTISDKIAKHVLKHKDINFKKYSWLDRGSDERQYCAPGVDLPIVNMMRSKHGTYPEYHTSLDNLDFISPSGLEGGLEMHTDAIKIIEKDRKVKHRVLCEPQLGKRNLRPDIGLKDNINKVKTLMNVLSLCDGEISVLEIAQKINEPFSIVDEIVNNLIEHDLLETI